MMRIALATFTLALALAVAPAGAGDPRIPLPDGWQPEGIAAGPGKALYVGSIPTGAILRLNPRNERTKVIVPGGEGRAATGIEVDGKHILAAGGDTGEIFAYDRRTGEHLKTIKAKGSFVNDVALLGEYAYFTDSQRAVLYRVKRDLTGAETIDIDVPLVDGFNLNGIEPTGDGHLLAVQSAAGKLWRIDPASGDAVAVDLGGAVLTNGDGLLLRGRKLYVVQNRDNKIAVVKLAKDFASGKVKKALTSSAFDVPTTIARQNGKLYAVNARFGTQNPQSAPYWVTRVK